MADGLYDGVIDGLLEGSAVTTATGFDVGLYDCLVVGE